MPAGRRQEMAYRRLRFRAEAEDCEAEAERPRRRRSERRKRVSVFSFRLSRPRRIFKHWMRRFYRQLRLQGRRLIFDFYIDTLLNSAAMADSSFRTFAFFSHWGLPVLSHPSISGTKSSTAAALFM
ncbi:hypothetical protein AXF42_Ash019047 [Apostasia shenzhenica]|uniref:Uncharacterized protein n=1 Tax=Apostasia shenzhenica TaxID=1088818 RepID=A0A2I0BB64_9ASPA|nr:hypothetical protein AXF42_Ash019047 [Apostasia shenzhenica]